MNEIAHRLLNRDTLNLDVLPGAVSFGTLSADALTLQKLLYLDRDDTSVFFRTVIRCIDADPALKSVLGEKMRTYDRLLRDYPTSVLPEGFTLVAATSVPKPGVLRVAYEWPIIETISVRRDADVFTVILGSRSEKVSSTEADGVYYPEWPSWSGIRGGVECDDSTDYDILHSPIDVALNSAVSRISSDGCVIRLLRTTSTPVNLRPYVYNTRNPERSFAALGALLFFSNDGVISE